MQYKMVPYMLCIDQVWSECLVRRTVKFLILIFFELSSAVTLFLNES
uniref:Uncharacterized protein n=1 Tax=Arundo donax TaxID=35708 RepID=A0A0A9C3F3_ARUDO